MSAVTRRLREPGQYAGFPAIPADEWRKVVAAGRRLPRLLDRVRRLESRLAELEAGAGR